MNCAVIDIGTLKVKFLIADVKTSGELNEVYSSSILTCFGSDIDANKGRVLEKNLFETLKELQRCKSILQKHSVKNFKVV